MKTTLIIKSVAAAALIAAGLANPAVSVASPDDGVKCINGFTAQFNGSALTCVKQVTQAIAEDRKNCSSDLPFEKFRVMANGQRDICLHRDVDIGSVDNLADFESGQVVVRIPVGQALPRTFQGRQPIRVANGLQTFRINENADFIFYDRSKSATEQVNRIRAIETAKAKAQVKNVTNGAEGDAENRLVSVTSDTSANRDRVDVKLELFTFAQPN